MRSSCFILLLVGSTLLPACGGSDSAPLTYKVTAEAGEGGTLMPAQATVAAGATHRIGVSVNARYQLHNVTGCNGTFETSSSQYIINSVESDCEVQASFALTHALITTKSSVGGAAAEPEYLVPVGESLLVDVLRNPGFDLAEAAGCNAQIQGEQLLVSPGTTDCTLQLLFEPVWKEAAIAPVISFPQQNFIAEVGSEVFLSADFHSFNGAVSSFRWVQIAGPDVLIENAETAGASFIVPEVGEQTLMTFEFIISDELDLVATEQLDIWVHPRLSQLSELLRGRPDGKGVDLVITGDGFTREQQGQLQEEVLKFVHVMFEDSTIGLHKDFWNVHFLPAVSNQSGVTNGYHGTARDTIFGSHFNCNDIERLLCVDTQALTEFVIDHVPQFDQILMIANDTKYGGAGYTGANIATFSLSESAHMVALHELGHSYAALADEYDFGDCHISGEPWASNVTINNDLSSVKWAHWVNHPDRSSEIGLFEGGYFCTRGVWRPTRSSIMRDMNSGFQSVNAEQWALAAYRYVERPVASSFPEFNELTLSSGEAVMFSVETYGDKDTQGIHWYINDQRVTRQQGEERRTLIVPPLSDSYQVRAEVYDTSRLVIRDPGALTRASLMWSVKVNHDE